MAVSTYTPLFRLVGGFGPLGLSLDPQAYGMNAHPVVMEPGIGSSKGASRYLQAGHGEGPDSLARILGRHRDGLSAAPSGPKDVEGVRGAASPGQQSYTLKFIAGRNQGGEFPLSSGREFVIGRSSDLNIVLSEDMVSRKHARISTVGAQVVIEDLGSTKGTYVNGEKIKKRALKVGDRILIGTTIMKLAVADAAASGDSEAEARARLESNARNGGRQTVSGRMSGLIEEIPLPDLLQLLSNSQKSGMVIIRSELGVGRIHLRQGRIYYCSINDNVDVHPKKAFHRLLRWTAGTFDLDPPDERPVSEEIQENINHLLMESMRQLDEINCLEDVPPPGSKLAVNPSGGRWRDLSDDELDVFQMVWAHGTLEAVLDHFPGSDLEANTHLISLLKRGFVVIP